MKINIILISYNQEKYISQAIEGILLQRTEHEIEVIIADDCSTDNTFSIIKSYEEQSLFPFKYLERTANNGFVKNYQRAFDACDGDYVAIIEGDDYWMSPYHISKHISFLDEHRECVMSMNSITHYIEDQYQFKSPLWDCAESYKLITTQDMALGNKLGNLSACILRNSELKKIKPDLFEQNIADWMLGMVLSQWGFIAILKDSTSLYRVNKGGLWSRKSEEERKIAICKGADRHNKYLEYRYDEQFTKLINSFNIKSKKTIYQHIKQLVPPLFIAVAKLLCPPIISNIIRRR